MYAIKLEWDKGLVPWKGRPGTSTISSSAPVSWPWPIARRYVDEHRTDERPLAVYRVSPKGRQQKKVYPLDP